MANSARSLHGILTVDLAEGTGYLVFRHIERKRFSTLLCNTALLIAKSLQVHAVSKPTGINFLKRIERRRAVVPVSSMYLRLLFGFARSSDFSNRLHTCTALLRIPGNFILGELEKSPSKNNQPRSPEPPFTHLSGLLQHVMPYG